VSFVGDNSLGHFSLAGWSRNSYMGELSLPPWFGSQGHGPKLSWPRATGGSRRGYHGIRTSGGSRCLCGYTMGGGGNHRVEWERRGAVNVLQTNQIHGMKVVIHIRALVVHATKCPILRVASFVGDWR
jgi:hypothetical protein